VTRVLAIDAERPDPDLISEAAAVIGRGGLVAFPTETVYGLGANALDPAAVSRIFDAKGRPATDPLIVHLAHIGQLGRAARDVPPVARALGLAFWAGPLTLILRKQPAISDAVTAGRDTVAVRVPAHRVARALMEACGVPVAAPSANRFSRPSPTRAAHVLADLDGVVDLVLDGGAASIGVESTIVDCTRTPPVLLRPGGITREQLLPHVPDLVLEARQTTVEEAQLAPGQLPRHYAPDAPLTLFVGAPAEVQRRLEVEARSLAGKGQRVGILAPEEDVLALAPRLAAPAASGRVLLRGYGRRSAPESAAHSLFHALRELDAEHPDVILAADVGPDALGAAIHDRLSRAAEGRVVRAGSR
jgi:L-threonylcarbamoyladenylate synthase